MFNLETQIRLALERVAEGRLEEAVDIADTVPPENADALLQVAQSLAGKAAFALADPLFERIIANSAPKLETWRSLIASARQRGDQLEGLARVRRAIVAMPDEPIFVQEGLLQYWLLHDIAGAEGMLADGIARFPQNADLALEWARMPAKSGERAVSLARSLEVFERFPFHVQPLTEAAEHLILLGRLEEAEALLERHRTTFGGTFHFMMQSASSATKLGRWQIALDRWADLVQRFSFIPDIDTHVGTALTLWRLAERAERVNNNETAGLRD